MARAPAASRNEFEAGPWRFLVVKSHILRSRCEKGRENGCDPEIGDICTVCRWVFVIVYRRYSTQISRLGKITVRSFNYVF